MKIFLAEVNKRIFIVSFMGCIREKGMERQGMLVPGKHAAFAISGLQGKKMEVRKSDWWK